MYKYNQDNKILKIEGEIFLAKHPNYSILSYIFNLFTLVMKCSTSKIITYDDLQIIIDKIFTHWDNPSRISLDYLRIVL